MSKRTFLKTLAFTVGLYFVLEYILPEKIGGAFDSFQVRSPAALVTPSGEYILYVGKYRKEQSAVGRLVPSPSKPGSWQTNPPNPVLRRSLFIPYDKWGMDQLDAFYADGTSYLLYIGRNPERKPVLCYASSNDDGLSWVKHNAVLLRLPGKPPQPTVKEPNGDLPGSVSFFAADYTNGTWSLLMIITRTAGGRGIWYASGPALNDLTLSPDPICSSTDFPIGIQAFDARVSSNGWLLTFISGSSWSSLLWNPTQPGLRSVPAVPLSTNTIVNLRNVPGTSRMLMAEMYKAALPPPPEQSPESTALLLFNGSNSVIKTIGAQGSPTYLSRATEWAGQFLVLIASFVVFMAVVNLIIFHGKKVIQFQKDWHNSIVFFVFLATMGIFTYFGNMISEDSKPFILTPQQWSFGWNFIFESFQKPMGIAVFSMITFFIVSAAYRSFKVRSAEAGLLMVSAVIVMLGQLPLGEWLAQGLPPSLSFLGLPWLAEKLLTVINAAAYRGVLIGILIGALSISLRIWLGIDNSVYTGIEVTRDE